MRVVPASADAYAELAGRFGASAPVQSLELIAARLRPPAHLTDGARQRGVAALTPS